MREAAAIARAFYREFGPGGVEPKPNLNASDSGEIKGQAAGTPKARKLEATTAGMADGGSSFQD